MAKQAPKAKDYTPTLVQSRHNVSEKFAIENASNMRLDEVKPVD
jgi:hypothetical protein